MSKHEVFKEEIECCLNCPKNKCTPVGCKLIKEARKRAFERKRLEKVEEIKTIRTIYYKYYKVGV